MPKGKPDLLHGTLELLILRSLAIIPRHGWAISKHLQQISEDVLEVNQGSLYPALYRLEGKGWIESEWGVTAKGRKAKVYSELTSPAAANADISGPSDDNNLDTDLGDLSGGTFLQDYDVYLNGELQEPGADAAANNDYYPGTALANGQLKFEFPLTPNDKIVVISFA